MATKLGKIVADFTSQLATKITVSGTTATLQSATDDDGVALASGRYFFTIDGDNTRKEHISADLSGTALTNIKSISRAGVESTGVAREHRVGATISITDFAHIKYLNDLLDGTTNLNASTPLEYDGTATINADNQLATKDYVDNVAIAGAPDSTTTTKGLVEKATTAEIDAGTATGGDGPLGVSPDQLASSIYSTRLPSADQKAALAGTSGTPSTSNKYVTNDDVTEANTASKIVRRDANSDVLVATTPTAGDAAASKTYVDTTVAAAKSKIAVVTTDVPVSGTSTETTLISTSIAGGTLSTNNAVRAKLYFSSCSTDNNSRTLTLRLKYGSTTVATAAITGNVFNWNTVGPVLCEAVLLGAGSTLAQEGSINFTLTGKNASSAWSGYTYHGFGTATEDSTGALNLVITAQWNNTSSDLTLAHATIERII